MSASADFGELVSMLNRMAPERLRLLQTRFSANAAELKPGGVLGESDSKLACAVASEALSQYGPQAAQIKEKLKARLAWSWRFDLLAKFAAACGSGGALGILVSGATGATSTATLASGVASAGSLASLIFSYLQRDESADSISEAYNKLIEALVSHDHLQRVMPGLCSAGDSAELTAVLTQANATARTLNELVLRYA
jgi:ABC-type multidrug transport system fused ATPase/permease subunit